MEDALVLKDRLGLGLFCRFIAKEATQLLEVGGDLSFAFLKRYSLVHGCLDFEVFAKVAAEDNLSEI